MMSQNEPTPLDVLKAFASLYDEAISQQPPHHRAALTAYAGAIYRQLADALQAGAENAKALEVIKAEQAAIAWAQGEGETDGNLG